MEQSRITLTKVKTNKTFSRDTVCFEAVLCFDGKPVCRLSNDGGGGPDHHDALKGETRTQMYGRFGPINEFIASLPGKVLHGKVIPRTLDWIVADILQDIQYTKDVARKMKTKLLFTCKGDENVYECKGTLRASNLEQFKKSQNVDLLLNEMPIEEAVKVFKARVRQRE